MTPAFLRRCSHSLAVLGQTELLASFSWAAVTQVSARVATACKRSVREPFDDLFGVVCCLLYVVFSYSVHSSERLSQKYLCVECRHCCLGPPTFLIQLDKCRLYEDEWCISHWPRTFQVVWLSRQILGVISSGSFAIEFGRSRCSKRLPPCSGRLFSWA